ncbi:MAG TPA: cysteine--tRNA ligase [Egibacteraceae bacterium]|nr:cysteine--tRNA ligase [Egibacteraceae bacterium]
MDDALRLRDTRTGELRPLDAGPVVRLYVCGITPYDATHLGHAFTYVAFDALIRYLEHRGHDVRYVRNVTDVDDDIFRVSRERQEPAEAIAARELDRFTADLKAMQCRPADVEPYASAHVPSMVASVEALCANGSAYALPDGRVYFDTAASDRYGRFAKLDRDEMLRQFAEKGGDPDAPGKRDPLDFLLWQPSAEGEPSWDSPWGAGRPGWHIECSVMAIDELGPTIDIHGGGSDLVYPHHEAEICQAEHVTGQEFSRFWLHTGMVALDGVKMSKSLGNLVFVSELRERFDPLAVRRYLLEHHYRQDWGYDEAELVAAAAGVRRWADVADQGGALPEAAAAFHEAMRSDLDTPGAVRAVDEAAAAGAGATVRELAGILGFPL